MANTPVITEDNSHTLMSGQFGVTYHSTHGAIQESQHVFIDAGLQFIIDKNTANNHTLNILEMGFGTGLNALLTYLYAEKHALYINYTSIEKYPISESEWKALNYCTLLGCPQTLFDTMHQTTARTSFSEHFTLEVLHSDIQNAALPNNHFNIIYYDAFAPDDQPELWTTEVFQKLYTCLATGGVLTTYCAKGQVRRNLQSAGFTVQRIPGPPFKREMISALKL